MKLTSKMKACSVGALLAAGTALAALAILLWLGNAQASDDQPVTFDQGTLSVETRQGVYLFEVEVAQRPEQWARGLMYRTDLAEDAGMLLVFPRDRRVGMWMKNTLIPLDMIFINSQGRVSEVAQHTTPLSLETILPTRPVRAVLEVRAGTAERLHMRPDDRVAWRLFSATPGTQ